MKYTLRTIALGITALAMAVLVRVQVSQSKYQLIMSGYNTPIATATPTPSNCTTVSIAGTNVPVGAACFARSSCPALTFPHDPATFPGADPNGVNDSSGAISSAIAAGVTQGGHGDLAFNTPGTYLVNLTTGGTYVNSAGIIPPASANINCVAGVTLQQTVTIPHDIGIFNLKNGANTVCGCSFVGPNNGTPPRLLNPNCAGGGNCRGQWLISMQGGSNYTIEGNTFTGSEGDSAVGDDDADTSNITVKFNTFFANPLYSFVIDRNTTTATISNNQVTDGFLGAEWDDCGMSGNATTIGTNINFQNNSLQSQFGDCFTAGSGTECGANGIPAGGAGYIAVGSSAACNYNGVTIGGPASANGNYCAGTSNLGAAYGVVTNGSAGTATVQNNVVGSFCTCNSGTGSC